MGWLVVGLGRRVWGGIYGAMCCRVGVSAMGQLCHFHESPLGDSEGAVCGVGAVPKGRHVGLCGAVGWGCAVLWWCGVVMQWCCIGVLGCCVIVVLCCCVVVVWYSGVVALWCCVV